MHARACAREGAKKPSGSKFLELPRIGEKVVLRIEGDKKAFRVTEVTHYASGVEGGA